MKKRHSPTCEANDGNPVAYLADVLIRVQTHPASRVDGLLPQNWKRDFLRQDGRSRSARPGRRGHEGSANPADVPGRPGALGQAITVVCGSAADRWVIAAKAEDSWCG
jgi:hypothetical protein